MNNNNSRWGGAVIKTTPTLKRLLPVSKQSSYYILVVEHASSGLKKIHNITYSTLYLRQDLYAYTDI